MRDLGAFTLPNPSFKIRHRLDFEFDFSRTAAQIATKICPVKFQHQNEIEIKKNEFPSYKIEAAIDKAGFSTFWEISSDWHDGFSNRLQDSKAFGRNFIF